MFGQTFDYFLLFYKKSPLKNVLHISEPLPLLLFTSNNSGIKLTHVNTFWNIISTSNGSWQCSCFWCKGASRDAEETTGLAKADKYGYSLIWATMSHLGNNKVKGLLDKGASPNKADSEGRTPLHWATITGNLTNVELLLSNGAIVDKADNSGRTPLYWASFHGLGAIAGVLLENGAAVEAQGHSALDAALSQGHCEIAQLLLARAGQSESSQELVRPQSDVLPRFRTYTLHALCLFVQNAFVMQ